MSERPQITGPDSGPEPPFPIRLNGRIVKGFGRGSKELGIPTANLPLSGLDIGGHSNIESGVYYGWASINLHGVVSSISEAANAPTPGEPSVKEQIAEASSKGATTPSHPSVPDPHDKSQYQIYPTVLSIGYNPFYKNEVRSVEVHVMHEFSRDFYNAMMNLSILGFIRPERDYDSMQELIEDIKMDCEVARRSLEREAYVRRKEDGYLKDFSWG